MGKKEAKYVSKEELYDAAVQSGLNHLVNEQGLNNYAVLIKNNVDREKLKYFLQKAEEKLASSGLSEEQQYKAMAKYLASYAASGDLLKDKTRMEVLDKARDKNTLERIADFFNPNRLGGDKYFEKAHSAYSDMYDILVQDKHAQNKFPELVKAAEAMKLYGFLNVALRAFKANGMMDDNLYNKLYKELRKGTITESQEGAESIQNYILGMKKKEEENVKEGGLEEKVAYKQASAIIGFLGILLIIFNLNITGNVIGGNSTVTLGIMGLFMIFFALLLLLRPLKKSFKK